MEQIVTVIVSTKLLELTDVGRVHVRPFDSVRCRVKDSEYSREGDGMVGSRRHGPLYYLNLHSFQSDFLKEREEINWSWPPIEPVFSTPYICFNTDDDTWFPYDHVDILPS